MFSGINYSYHYPSPLTLNVQYIFFFCIDLIISDETLFGDDEITEGNLSDLSS